MEAKELRIGNYLSWSGEAMRVDVNDFTNGIGEGQPIPLTEEWIIKFGFGQKNKSKSNSIYHLIMNERNATHSVYLIIGFLDGNIYPEFYIGKSPKNKLLLDIKYVHELQIFCQTFQHELTIKA